MQRVWIVVLVALLGYLTYQVFAPFIIPIAWAIVLAIMFYRPHAFIQSRLKRPNLSALITTLLITMILIVPALLVASAFVQQAVETAKEVRDEWAAGHMPFESAWQSRPVQTAFQWLEEMGYSQDEMQNWMREGVRKNATALVSKAGSFATNIVLFVFNLFMMLFATFYLLRGGPQLLARVRDILPISESRREGLIDIAYNVLYASVVSSFVVAAVQGTLGGLLFWILGIDNPLLWGVVMGFLSLLPLLGAWIVWIPAGLTLLDSGAYWKAAILLAVALGIISTVDNLLRPWLISGRVQLNGLLIFISILGGIAAFGMIGVILGPILVALGEAVLVFFSGEDKMTAVETAPDAS